MKLNKLYIKNFRSIKDSGEINVCSLHALVGENNTGKSNILLAIEAFLSAGSGGVTIDSFNDESLPIIIKGEFIELTPSEKKVWKPYLVNGNLILEKQFRLESDVKSGKVSVKTEYHGYKAEPKEWFLSIEKIHKKLGDRPKWLEIVEGNKLPDYFLQDRKCNKISYAKGLERYIQENDIEFDEPDISNTQALGLQSNVIASLPAVYILRAITDYNDEVNQRSSTTTFRKLVGDLTDRLLKTDPRYQEIQAALNNIRALLNETAEGAEVTRLDSLNKIEAAISGILSRLMPSVKGIRLQVETDEIKDIFSRGITISVDDGVLTEVVLKGHGLQRCVVFSLLQALILNQRNQLVSDAEGENAGCDIKSLRTILLLIEEPELYIHPQLQKLFFDVMKSFSITDQVIYTTHSPLMIDAYEYESISIIRKENVNIGTKVNNCNKDAFDGMIDKKVFQGLTQLNPNVNELFFAKKVILVEGPEDKIAITETAKYLKKIVTRTEEIEMSIIVAGGKQSIPFFQRVLNAFGIPYVVLHDLDIEDGMDPDNKVNQEKQNKLISELAGENKVVTFPIRLESTLNLAKRHLKDQFEAYQYFMNHDNLTDELIDIVKQVIE